jgi:hypothetical protein
MQRHVTSIHSVCFKKDNLRCAQLAACIRSNVTEKTLETIDFGKGESGLGFSPPPAPLQTVIEKKSDAPAHAPEYRQRVLPGHS